MGKARRTDWLPVGGGDVDEQLVRSADSADTSSNSDFGSEDQSDSASFDDKDRGHLCACFQYAAALSFAHALIYSLHFDL